MIEEDTTAMGTTPRLFDSVKLLVALPDEPYAGSHPPEDWHGLVPGDRGAVVEVFDTPPSYTVEFFRDGRTVAVTDVTLEQVQVIRHAQDNRPTARAERTAD